MIDWKTQNVNIWTGYKWDKIRGQLLHSMHNIGIVKSLFIVVCLEKRIKCHSSRSMILGIKMNGKRLIKRNVSKIAVESMGRQMQGHLILPIFWVLYVLSRRLYNMQR